MKKIISILIALTMLVSMLPSVFAEGETETPQAVEYTFTQNAVGSSDKSVALSTVLDYGNHGWMYFDYSENIKEDLTTKNARVGAVRQADAGRGLNFYMNGAGIAAGEMFALSLEAPETAGFYIPTIYWYQNQKNSTLYIYMNNYVNNKNAVEDYGIDENLVLYVKHETGYAERNDKFQKALYVSGSEDIITTFKLGKFNYGFYDITMTPVLTPTMTMKVGYASLDLTDDDTTNDTTAASVVVSGKTVVDSVEETITDMPVSNNFITYKSSSDAVATVSADGTVTAVGAGEAKIWAESKDGLVKSNEVTVTVTGEEEPTEDAELTEAFKVTETTVSGYVESTVTGLTEDTTIEAEKNSDGTFLLTAPETKSDKKFLYWAKGMSANKKIVSFSNKLGNYMPEENGKNYLIAVYEGDVSETAEYYNANGQRIATGTEPTLPAMAGYGNATGWAKYDETNIYVAEYENKTQPDNVTVTVDGKANTIPYGTEITCTADSTKENFKCWTKSDINGKTEIVSANETYKFKAWETCTVTAIYEEHTYTGEKFKIIIDTFTAGNATAVMAEFVGFGSDVVEKGIMFEGKKIAMTKPGNQFTVIADESGTYEGYVIVGNQKDGYKLITDGEYKK